ncbi:zinc metallopeptidase RseP [Idiomarina tyrosinivorans]|uniref:Zinc metalloprotease n=1 Tax=Idiomarina tyrosinivorans TaxID=1445662 RepID=A0A432ZRN5_9GAMM|nr:sigma E protease regulator RseP [Idiomarina tyrosinivorans]RUO80567.1 zinc metallopeptidase RseP [Idiomarina tyrosinivorans]
MLEMLWYAASFVVTLGILVTFHEWGHFYVARRCGVKVLTFSVGFGKALWRRTGKDGTVYQLGLIPLGGYVRMLDERIDDVSPEQRPVSFNAQSVYKRFAVVAAGPVANFVLAVVALWLMFVIGVPSIKPIIGDVQPQSIAAQAELHSGQEIVRINDTETYDWQRVQLGLMAALGNQQATIVVRNPDGSEQTRTLQLSDWQFDPEKQATFTSLGIEVFQPKVYRRLASVANDSPAAAAGFKKGDEILAINGDAVSDWQTISAAIRAAAGETLEFRVRRDQQNMTIQAKIGERETGSGVIGFLGVVPQAEPYPAAYRFNHQYGPVEAVAQGAARTWDLMVVSVQMIGKLLTGDVSVKNLAGPLSIAEGAGISANQGLVYFLGFLALLSVNLGIINLLPLPVLDGGHLLFFVIEWARGKPVSEKIQDVCYRIGGALVFALMLLAITNDIFRFVL